MLLPQIVDVSEKGQILIPVAMRKALGIRPKGKVFLYPKMEEGKVIIAPMKKDDIIESAYGMLARDDGKKWTDELLKEKRRDLIKEETKFERLFKKKVKRVNK